MVRTAWICGVGCAAIRSGTRLERFIIPQEALSYIFKVVVFFEDRCSNWRDDFIVVLVLSQEIVA